MFDPAKDRYAAEAILHYITAFRLAECDSCRPQRHFSPSAKYNSDTLLKTAYASDFPSGVIRTPFTNMLPVGSMWGSSRQSSIRPLARSTRQTLGGRSPRLVTYTDRPSSLKFIRL